jgi:hypothetical protein
MRALRRLKPDLRTVGGLLCVVGFTLLARGALFLSALGLEAIAAAFWLWARASDDAPEQVARWVWLRRPATALWLAGAVHAAAPWLSHQLLAAGGTTELLLWVEAVAVAWAGLELLAALPLARPYSDLPGPFVALRPLLPVLLPAAGFLVLWIHSAHWSGVVPIRQVAVALLLATAALAALRAFARRQWTASLRWLVISDSALAAVLVAHRSMPADASLLLWLGAAGGHGVLLAGELRGAITRRGTFVTRLWRAASGVALACLAWPALLAAGAEPGRVGPIYFGVASFTVALAAWITVGRITRAPERRLVMRPDPVLTVSQLAAVAVLAAGPVALARGWWAGFEPPWRASILALIPVLVGSLGALLVRQGSGVPVRDALRRIGAGMPNLARSTFRTVVAIERRAVSVLVAATRAVTTPLHDLHTGDAQEYLLFLVGVGVLALVLPLLR